MVGPVAIVGYMGSGKTTVGRALALTLGLEFVDLDRMLVKQEGREISEIFAESGEDYFRDLEHRTLLEALEGSRPSVLACGGGIVLRQENRAALGEVTTVFLSEDTKVLYDRTRRPGRPLRAASRGEFERRYAERLPLYREVADLEVEVRGRPAALVAEEVIRCLSRL
ncbi:MAG: shikimate kinase [Rubrobacter sp.]